MLTKAMFASIFVIGLMVSFATPNAVALQSRATVNVSHHLTVGSRVYGDYLLSQQVVTKSSTWLTVVTQDVTVITPQNQTISLVRALDQKTNGNGAYASLTNGGPGSRNVTLHFKSQRGHGINFVVEIYGR